MRRGPKAAETITERERVYLDMIAQGLDDNEIAEACGVTPGAIKAALHRACRRMNIAGKIKLELWYMESTYDG